jgi:hypothetical protein
MPQILKACIRCVVGFAFAVLVTAVWLSVQEASRPNRNTHEFPNPVHAFLFCLFIWGVLLNLVVSSGFALGLAPLLRYVPSLRFPLLTGITAGLGTQALSVIGIPGGLGLPWSYGSFVSALTVGFAVSLLRLVPVLIHRVTARGA